MRKEAVVVGQVLRELIKNAAMGVPVIRTARLARIRTAVDVDRTQLDRYAFQLLDRITKHLGPVEGKSILEIGPGDHLASGLAFLAAGAKSYTALDRFPGAYSSDLSRAWYRLMAQTWSQKYPHLEWPSHLDPERFPDCPQVTTYAQSVEDFDDSTKYDFVCSFAVGEHVSDINAFAAVNKRALKQSGAGLHVIDFGGHNWDMPEDPYLFLRFPKLLWSAMGSNRGLPNRERFDDYVAAFERSGLSVDVVESRGFRASAAKPPAWVNRLPEASRTIEEGTFVVRPMPPTK